eukprot:COSAG01_NODE_1433_length_10317_cov_590.337366_7_plen_181_part_00
MNIIVKSKQMDLSSKLKSYMHGKIEKLEHFFHNTQEVILELEETSLSSDSERYEANATIHASGTTLHAKERAHDSFAVVDLIYEKLQVQLRKHKEKLSSKKGKRRAQRALREATNSSIPAKTLSQEDNTEHFVRKPIDIDEAAGILADKALSFLVFRDMHTEKISVIYPLSNEELGLIET